MPQRRGRGKRGAPLPLGWVWLAALIVVGAAVLAARTFERRTSAEPTPPSVAATPTSIPRAAAATAEPARPTPTSSASTPKAIATKTPVPRAVLATAAPVRVAPTSTSAPPHTAAATTVPIATPEPTFRPQQQRSNATSARGVGLTFDAGADRGYAEDILDVLQEQHVLGSFGITGAWAKANPDLVRRMAADGHLVFNHTMDHRSFTGTSDSRGGLSPAARRAELDEADAIIAPLIGHTTKPFYRLPYGDDDARVAADVGSEGYTHKIGWTVDTLGWRGVQSTDIVARSLKLAAPGAVYVMHVGRASQDAIALPQIIHALRDKGFAFQRIDQL